MKSVKNLTSTIARENNLFVKFSFATITTYFNSHSIEKKQLHGLPKPCKLEINYLNNYRLHSIIVKRLYVVKYRMLQYLILMSKTNTNG